MPGTAASLAAGRPSLPGPSMQNGLRRQMVLRPSRERSLDGTTAGLVDKDAVAAGAPRLPPWLKNAHESAVVTRLRQNLTAGEKSSFGNKVPQHPPTPPVLQQVTPRSSVVPNVPDQGVRTPTSRSLSKSRETGRLSRQNLHGARPGIRVNTPDKLRQQRFGSPPVSPARCAPQGLHQQTQPHQQQQPQQHQLWVEEVARLDVKLSQAMSQILDANVESQRLQQELAEAQQALSASQAEEQRLVVEVEHLRDRLDRCFASGGEALQHNPAGNAEVTAKLEAAIAERDEVKATLASTTAELSETRVQLDFVRKEFDAMKESMDSTSEAQDVAVQHAHLVSAQLDSMNAQFQDVKEAHRDAKEAAAVVEAENAELRVELQKAIEAAEEMETLRVEVQAARDSQARAEDAWWTANEPKLDKQIGALQMQVETLRAEFLAAQLVKPSGGDAAPMPGMKDSPLDQERTAAGKADTESVSAWGVFYENGVNVRNSKDPTAAILGCKGAGMIVYGRQDCGWVALAGEPGFMKISNEGIPLMRKVRVYVTPCS